jgi:hypothetical protein
VAAAEGGGEHVLVDLLVLCAHEPEAVAARPVELAAGDAGSVGGAPVAAAVRVLGPLRARVALAAQHLGQEPVDLAVRGRAPQVEDAVVDVERARAVVERNDQVRAAERGRLVQRRVRVQVDRDVAVEREHVDAAQLEQPREVVVAHEPHALDRARPVLLRLAAGHVPRRPGAREARARAVEVRARAVAHHEQQHVLDPERAQRERQVGHPRRAAGVCVREDELTLPRARGDGGLELAGRLEVASAVRLELARAAEAADAAAALRLARGGRRGPGGRRAVGRVGARGGRRGPGGRRAVGRGGVLAVVWPRVRLGVGSGLDELVRVGGCRHAERLARRLDVDAGCARAGGGPRGQRRRGEQRWQRQGLGQRRREPLRGEEEGHGHEPEAERQPALPRAASLLQGPPNHVIVGGRHRESDQ